MSKRFLIALLIPIGLFSVAAAAAHVFGAAVRPAAAMANLCLLILIWPYVIVRLMGEDSAKPIPARSPAPYGAAIETGTARPSDASAPRIFPLEPGSVRWYEPAEPTALRYLGTTLKIPGIDAETALVDVVAAWENWIKAQPDKREALLRVIGAMAHTHDRVVVWRVAERFRRENWPAFSQRERETLIRLWEEHGDGNTLLEDNPIAGTDPEKAEPTVAHAEEPGHGDHEEQSEWRTTRIGADRPPTYARIDPYGHCGRTDWRYVIQVWSPRARLADGSYVQAGYGYV